MGILITCLGIALVLWLLVGFICFYIACRRGKEIRWLEPEAVAKTAYAPYVELIRNSCDWLQKNAAQDVYITSHDDLRLHGTWIPCENSRGTIILAHGYRSTMLVDFGKVMAFYHTLGLNVLMIDQRCHGASEGRYITFGVRESEDVLRWITWHNQQFAACPVILSGLSMGASTVMFLADHSSLPDNVVGLIADCGFSSPAAIIKKVFRDIMHFSPGGILWSADIWARLLAGFSLYEKDSCTALAHTKLPVALIHGKADDFVPYEMTLQAFDACNSTKELLIAEGAGHGLSFLKEKERYIQMLQDFLDRNLR